MQLLVFLAFFQAAFSQIENPTGFNNADIYTAPESPSSVFSFGISGTTTDMTATKSPISNTETSQAAFSASSAVSAMPSTAASEQPSTAVPVSGLSSIASPETSPRGELQPITSPASAVRPETTHTKAADADTPTNAAQSSANTVPTASIPSTSVMLSNNNKNAGTSLNLLPGDVVVTEMQTFYTTVSCSTTARNNNGAVGAEAQAPITSPALSGVSIAPNPSVAASSTAPTATTSAGGGEGDNTNHSQPLQVSMTSTTHTTQTKESTTTVTITIFTTITQTV